MKTNISLTRWITLLALAMISLPSAIGFSQGTAFSYQGRFYDGNSPANGLYDLRFIVWDAPTNGSVVAGPLTNSATGITNGLFAVALDFGDDVFTGPDRWLQLEARTNGADSFTPILPRQPFLSVPYAMMAGSASNLLGTLPLAQLPPSVVTNNGGAVMLTGVFSGNGAGLTNLGAASVSGSLTNISNIYLPVTTANAGVIYAGSNTLIHDFGLGNFFAGAGAGNLAMSGNDNTAVGYWALRDNTTGNYNTAIGLYALVSNSSGNFNTANGAGAMGNNAAGYENVADGAWALENNTSGYFNTAGGAWALVGNTTGNNNTAFGWQALAGNGGGNNNTAVGWQALAGNRSGTDNTAVGWLALGNIGTGNNNIALGKYAGYDNNNGNNNIDIGNRGSGSDTNIIRIGDIQTQTYIAGVINGNGAGLTNINSSSLTGNSLTLGGTNEVAPLTVPPTVPAAATGGVGRGNGPDSIAVAGNYAYVTSYDAHKLLIFDVSTPAAPVNIGQVDTVGGPDSVAVAGRYAYVANYDLGRLQIFDISVPTAPISIVSTTCGGKPTSLAVAGHYVYLVNYDSSTLQIMDVSTPTAPISVRSQVTDGHPWSVAVAGRYAYVANYGANTLEVYDISTPATAFKAGSVPTDGGPYSVAVAGRYAYVANYGSNTLQVFDVSTSSVPVTVGSVGTQSEPHAVAVAGRYAYVVNAGNNTLQLFDVSTPSAPVRVGSVGTGSNPNSVAVVGRYAYVVNWGGDVDLQVFDLGGAYIQQLEAGALETGTLQTRDTATVGNNLDVRGGLTVSASARISGGLSVDNGAITAMNFVGNGGGLTNLSGMFTGDMEAPRLMIGTDQTLAGTGSSIAGGVSNSIAQGDNSFGTLGASFIGGGYENLINSNSFYTTLAGGGLNSIGQYSQDAAIGGGYSNTISDNSVGATIPGGLFNVAAGQGAFAAGQRAQAIHSGTFVWCDFHGTNFTSTAPNQFLIHASGGVAIGTNNPAGAALRVVGTVVADAFIGDGSGLTNLNMGMSSTATNFSGSLAGDVTGTQNATVVASVGGLSAALVTNGVSAANAATSANTASTIVKRDGSGNFTAGAVTASGLTVNGEATVTAINITSDRNAKEDFAAVQPRDVLEKVTHLPISEWQYKSQPGVRHIGPMAQDFREAFGTGRDEKHITTVDADGVALAAIQGLNQKVEEMKAALHERDTENAELKKTVGDLKKLIEQLNQRVSEDAVK